MNTSTIMASPSENVEDYSTLLAGAGLNCRANGLYLSAGAAPVAGDAVLYLSAVQLQIIRMLEEVLPLLITEGLGFRLAKDRQTAKLILDGRIGYEHIGKVMIIFIPKARDFSKLVQKLVQLTATIKGPLVPGLSGLGATIYLGPAFGVLSAALPELTEKSKPMLVKGKYLVLSHLKKDAKGDVMAGLYLGRFFIPKKFVVKEGRYAMWSDEAGRDMKDRLEWQKHIHHDLSPLLRVPRVIDLYEDKGNTYLVMEFIKGPTLETLIDDLYQGSTWLQLPSSSKVTLLELLNKVLDAVQIIHSKGYLHRDLSPVNFILGRDNVLVPMDFELAYSIPLQFPLPAFGLGTPGFMSPEQKAGRRPATSQDIYALAALMVVLFTNLPPLKFDLSDTELFSDQLLFFTGDRFLSELFVTPCLSPDPAGRLTISELKKCVRAMLHAQRNDPENQLRFEQPPMVRPDDLRELISRSFAGLTNPELTAQGKLFKIPGKADLRVRNARTGSSAGVGLEVPITGVLYLLAADTNCNCPDGVKDLIAAEVLQYKEFFHGEKLQPAPGLFNGLAGKALALHYGRRLGLLEEHEGLHSAILACFQSQAKTLDLAGGLAGQLLSALYIYRENPCEALTILIADYADLLISTQLPDGSWPLHSLINGRKEIQAGLTEGVAGVICALLKYDEQFPSLDCREAICRAMHWLTEYIRKSEAGLPGKRGSCKLDTSFTLGSSGTALTFLYAYEHFGREDFKFMAEHLLQSLPEYSISRDFSLATGMAGLGFVYTEAYRLTRNDQWLRRANWVYQVFTRTVHTRCNNTATWNMNGLDEYDGSVLTGTAGIISFLLKLEQAIIITNERYHEQRF